MSSTERTEKLAAYGAAYEQLRTALAEFPASMWHVRTSADPWTIHEIVVHITDSEANSYVRCRRAIAEPGESVMAYNEERWASALDYSAQSAGDALE
ncbi:MAG TPA: hypothetical protein VM536_17420, partial [Chloroflexia bacterium]|nr:hypothetical protein [Chloroflexia bacterium]